MNLFPRRLSPAFGHLLPAPQRLLPGLALALALALPRTAVRAQTFPAGSVVSATRPNGLRLVVKRSPGDPIAAVSIWIKAGSRNETKENNGVAHLLEHYLFEAPAGAPSYERTVEGMGGTLNAETAHDNTHFYATVPTGSLAPALGVLAGMIRRPTFDPTRLDVERSRAQDEVQNRLAEPMQVLQRDLYTLAYPNSPYSLPEAGIPETIGRLTSDQIRAFYDAYYRPDNALVVITGDIKMADAAALVGKLFDDWRAPAEALAPVPQETDRSTSPPPRLVPLPGGTETSVLMLGFPAPSIQQSRDSVVMDLIYTLLVVGQRSLLYDRLSRPGVLTDIGGDFVTVHDPGLFIVWGYSKAADLKAARQKLIDQVQGLAAGGFTAEDLARAKRSLLGSYTLENETTTDQNTNLGFYDAIDSYEYAVRYDSVIRSISPSDIRSVARRYFTAVYTVAMAAEGTPL